MASPNGLLHRLKTTPAWRAWQRYGRARGGVLAGGMAYVAFFSLLPALALGFTVFGLIVGDNADLQNRVIKSVNDGVGTTVITPRGGSGGIIGIDALTSSNALTVAGIIGLVGFLFTGLGWLDAMREGVRAMFGQPTFAGNFVRTKLRDLGVLVTLGIVLLLSAVGGIVASGATGAVLGWVGLDGSTIGRLVVGAVSTLLLLAVDIIVFMVIFRLLSGVDVPSQDLWDAALFGGIGFGVLKLLGGLLLNSAGNNKFLASAGVLLGLLVWLNLLARLTLVAASWGATVAIDRGHLADPLALPVPPGRPASAAPATGVPVPAAAFTPVVSPRAADRISVASGAVLGAAAVVTIRTATRALRSVRSMVS